jgi:AraC-like DNA-binding protein
MISLEQLLDGLEVAVEPLATHAIRRDGSIDCGQMDGPAIHYALRGSGRLEIADGETVGVSARTVIVVPPGHHARIVTQDGGRRSDVRVACVGIRATYRGSIGLFDHLHEPLVEHVAADDPVRQSFEELLDEVDARRPGCRAMSEALLRRCLIWLLRRFFGRGRCGLGWLAPLEDARLGRAVTAMHERPQHSFTLPELAEVAGMSRSVFAARFSDTLGQSPIEFLKALRLARAAQLLARTDLPVKGVAARSGYSSRSSFTRAFVARHGIAPAAFRATGRGPLPEVRRSLGQMAS